MPPGTLPSYPPDGLTELENTELIAILIRDEDRVPRNVIDELARRGDSAVTDLEDWFASPEAWSPDVPDGAWWLRLHAAMIFGLVPTTNAGEALVGWIRRLDEAVDEHTQEWLSGYWPALFANKPGAVVEPLRELSGDRLLDWFARADAMEAVVAAAERLGLAALDAELEWVARLAADEQEDWDARMSAAHLLLEFPRPAHRELLESLAKRQGTLGAMFTPGDVEEAYQAGRDEPQWRRFADPWQFYEPAAIEARQRRWAEERESEPDDSLLEDELADWAPEAPYVREAPKVGRNEPCPCGSGKKYKKCCLLR